MRPRDFILPDRLFCSLMSNWTSSWGRCSHRFAIGRKYFQWPVSSQNVANGCCIGLVFGRGLRAITDYDDLQVVEIDVALRGLLHNGSVDRADLYGIRVPVVHRQPEVRNREPAVK